MPDRPLLLFANDPRHWAILATPPSTQTSRLALPGGGGLSLGMGVDLRDLDDDPLWNSAPIVRRVFVARDDVAADTLQIPVLLRLRRRVAPLIRSVKPCGGMRASSRTSSP